MKWRILSRETGIELATVEALHETDAAQLGGPGEKLIWERVDEGEEPLVGAACWICSGTSYVMVGRGARCLGCKAIHYGWKLEGGAS